MLALIVFGALIVFMFGALGIHFRRGKGIRWVNFLDYKSGKYDESKLLRFLGNIMFLFALTGVFWILSGMDVAVLCRNGLSFLRGCIYTDLYKHRKTI